MQVTQRLYLLLSITDVHPHVARILSNGATFKIDTLIPFSACEIFLTALVVTAARLGRKELGWIFASRFKLASLDVSEIPRGHTISAVFQFEYSRVRPPSSIKDLSGFSQRDSIACKNKIYC